MLEVFDSYAWPGNVRELRNVVERAALFCRRSKIGIEDVPPGLVAASRAPRRAPSHQAMTLQEAVERAEIETIRAALSTTDGRRSEAAQLLGVSRKTLWEKTKHYGLGAD